jgi:hypothetical protein
VRAQDEPLKLAANAPVLEPGSVDAAVGEDGIARFEPVPEFGLSLALSSGPFRASVAIPAGPGPTRVQARLARVDAPEGGTYREWERSRWR